MRALLVWMTAATIFYGGASDNWAAEPEVKYNLLTLPGARVAAEQLAAPAQLFGDRITLRASVAQLAEVYQFSYWIDRQVDADKPLTISLREATLGEYLTSLARDCEADVGLVENVITIASPSRLASLQYTAVRLHDQLSRSQPSTANRSSAQAAQLRGLAWPMLTTPTELYEEIGKNWGFRSQVELPHDLMNAGKLHPCTVATQLTLLLGGFDRCAVGRKVNELRIAPLPKASAWQAVYSTLPEANIAAALADFPDAKVERDGKQVIFSGTTAAHLRLLHSHLPHGGASTATSRPGRPGRSQATQRPRMQAKEEALLAQRYTIRQDQPQPLRGVVMALAGQLGLEVQWSDALAPVDVQRPVTLDEKDASLDDILGRLGAQANVSIVRSGVVVQVKPPASDPPE